MNYLPKHVGGRPIGVEDDGVALFNDVAVALLEPFR
jgi:hypothetical protein